MITIATSKSENEVLMQPREGSSEPGRMSVGFQDEIKIRKHRSLCFGSDCFSGALSRIAIQS